MLFVIATCNTKYSVKNDKRIYNQQISVDTIYCELQLFVKLNLSNCVNISIVFLYQALFKYHGDVSNLSSQDPCKHIACNQ